MKHALVVDDGTVERIAATDLLEQMGFEVSTAPNGAEALKYLASNTVDLVVCDITMPIMDGLTLLKESRQLSPPPMFVMATSLDDLEPGITATRMGAYGYLVKPLKIETLRTTVADAVARYQVDRNAALEAQKKAITDAQTGLPNREEFARRLTACLTNAPTESKPREGALLIAKLTRLTHVNHIYGRPAGDKALMHAAATLERLVRPEDILARFSGDRFIMYLGNIGAAQITARAEAIAQAVESSPVVLRGDACSLSLAIGCTLVQPGMPAEELISQADFAMHLAKKYGHQAIHVYQEADESHKRELSQQLANLSLVRAALDEKRFAMYYQPIVDLGTGEVKHYEALLRVRGEDGTIHPPGELIKTCEVFGLIGRLDKAVVEVCLEGIGQLPQSAGLSINLSGKSIEDPDLQDLIESRIAALGIDAQRITFELTETAAFNNLEEVKKFILRIKRLGCRFALDDFGVGFSSFYYIKELDFDYLKIDGSFVVNMTTNLNDQVFIRAMVEISKVFGMRLIAEFVEDNATAQLLKQLGVTYGQGYYFGKPKAASSLWPGHST